VIQDNKFILISNISDGTQYLDKIGVYLAMPSGVIRGALANLGISAVVNASVEKLPIVRFNLKINTLTDDSAESHA
jgi:hypothetical protein